MAALVFEATSHILTVPSSEPEASMVPLEEKATDKTLPVCPSKVAIFVSDFTSHNSTFSPVPEARVVPSGEKATEKMGSCDSRVANLLQVDFSHSSIVPSVDPLAIIVPSREKATDRTSPVCVRRRRVCCVATSQISTPFLPETRVAPSGENETDRTALPPERVAMCCLETFMRSKDARPTSPSESTAATRIECKGKRVRFVRGFDGITPSYSNSTTASFSPSNPRHAFTSIGP